MTSVHMGFKVTLKFEFSRADHTGKLRFHTAIVLFMGTKVAPMLVSFSTAVADVWSRDCLGVFAFVLLMGHQGPLVLVLFLTEVADERAFRCLAHEGSFRSWTDEWALRSLADERTISSLNYERTLSSLAGIFWSGFSLNYFKTNNKKDN